MSPSPVSRAPPRADAASVVPVTSQGAGSGAGTAGAGPPWLTARPQELEQQLMMEKRNYGKTLKFYQKLLQKEKRTRGSARPPGPAPGR